MIKIKRNSPLAILPTRGTPHSAGYDLYSTKDCIIDSHKQEAISTDISIEMPEGTYGRIAMRSSLARDGLMVGGGVIDPDYRGPITVLIFNMSQSPYQIKRGQRIAQLICEKYVSASVVEVHQLSDTSRGSKGFGHTGR